MEKMEAVELLRRTHPHGSSPTSAAAQGFARHLLWQFDHPHTPTEVAHLLEIAFDAGASYGAEEPT